MLTHSLRLHGQEHGPLRSYLGAIHATALLAPEEEHELAQRIATGDVEARDHLVRANLRLVVFIARDYTGRGLSLEDLIAEGNLGLMRAVESFDPAATARFSTYASYWIKQSIRAAIIKQGRLVRLPQHVANLLAKWRRAAAVLTKRLGREPEFAEIAQVLGLSRRKWALVQDALVVQQAAVTAAAADDQEGPELVDERGDAAVAALEATEQTQWLQNMLDRLSAQEATILRLRYGLEDGQPQSLQEVGQRLGGYTRQRISQLEQQGLKRLRATLA